MNPSNPHQVGEDGRWVPTRIVTEPIVIRGNPKPFMFAAEFTRHGVSSLRMANAISSSPCGGAAPSRAPCGQLAVLALNRASSWSEFAGAVARWKAPALRVTYADAEAGADRSPAEYPVRRGWNGALPAPGWPGTHEWTGWQSPASNERRRGDGRGAGDCTARRATLRDRVAALLQKLSRGRSLVFIR